MPSLLSAAESIVRSWGTVTRPLIEGCVGLLLGLVRLAGGWATGDPARPVCTASCSTVAEWGRIFITCLVSLAKLALRVALIMIAFRVGKPRDLATVSDTTASMPPI